MKKVYNYIISIVLLFSCGIQARSVREYIQSTPGAQLIIHDVLDLSNCELTSLEGLEDVPHPETIHALALHDNELETIPVGMLDRFVNLQRIYLSDNQLRELQTQVFNALTQLTDIDLSSKLITTKINIKLY